MEVLSRASDAVSDIDLIGAGIRGDDQHWELLPAQVSRCAIFHSKFHQHIEPRQNSRNFDLPSVTIQLLDRCNKIMRGSVRADNSQQFFEWINT